MTSRHGRSQRRSCVVERTVELVDVTVEERQKIFEQLTALQHVRPTARPVAVVLLRGSVAYGTLRAVLEEGGYDGLGGDRLVGVVSSSMARMILRDLQPEALPCLRALPDDHRLPLLVAKPGGWLGVGSLRLCSDGACHSAMPPSS